MYPGWLPTENFDDMALYEGFCKSDWLLQTTEFCSFWSTQGAVKTAHQWDKTFLQNLIANRKYSEAHPA
jgi:hypothetical protein